MATSESNRGSKSRGGSARKAAAAALHPDTLLDIVQRLGVMDIALDKVRARIQEIDYDDLLDEAERYVRRNPEVVVIGLGVLTITAAAIVYLDHRLDDERRWGGGFEFDDDEDDEPIRAVKPAPAKPRAAAPARRRKSA